MRCKDIKVGGVYSWMCSGGKGYGNDLPFAVEVVAVGVPRKSTARNSYHTSNDGVEVRWLPERQNDLPESRRREQGRSMPTVAAGRDIIRRWVEELEIQGQIALVEAANVAAMRKDRERTQAHRDRVRALFSMGVVGRERLIYAVPDLLEAIRTDSQGEELLLDLLECVNELKAEHSPMIYADIEALWQKLAAVVTPHLLARL